MPADIRRSLGMCRPDLHRGLLTFLVLLILLLVHAFAPVAGEEPTIATWDDFDTSKDHWMHWAQRTGGITISDGICCLRITNEATSQNDHLAALYDCYQYPNDLKMPWLYKGVELKLRCSDDNRANSETGGGIRFWGLASLVPFQIPPENALYFWSGSPECGEGYRGLSTMTTINAETVNIEPIGGVDITEWHTYTILWDENQATYLIDGETVATIGQSPSEPMGVILLISNMITGGEGCAMDLENDQTMEIDSVKLFYTDEEDLLSESSQIGELSNETASLIDQAEGLGAGIQKLRADHTQAGALWADERRYLQVKDILEGIIQKAQEAERCYVATKDLKDRITAFLDEVEALGFDTQELRANYTEAEALLDQCYFCQAKMLLEGIDKQAEGILAGTEVEKYNWFEAANQTIEEAEQEGRTRDALIMKGKLEAARSCWEDEDFACTRRFLEQIIAIPEGPTILGLVTLPLLGLLGLPRHPSKKGQ